MVSRQILLGDREYIDSNTLALLTRLSSTFTSDIRIKSMGRQTDAKSLNGIMILIDEETSQIEIEATGIDEEKAINEIEKFIISKLGV